MKLDPILVGTDFSAQSRAALEWAIELARPIGARVLVVHVFDLPLIGFLDASIVVDAVTAARISADAQAALDAVVSRARDHVDGVTVEGLLRQGDPRIVLPELAVSVDAALLVVGSHGRRGLSRALLGSVAESVVRASTVPVVVVRDGTRIAREQGAR
jgi:nucleotide-binding universal stress UspA family protein